MQLQKRVQKARAALLAAALTILTSPAFAGAPGFDRVNTVFTNVNTALIAAGVAIMTMAILWCGYKITFKGASFEDISKPLIGGIVLGAAPTLAGFLMS